MTRDGPVEPERPDAVERPEDVRARRRQGSSRGWRARSDWSGERPEWWPTGEAWPPPGPRPPWMRRRPHRARGFGCLFGLVFLVAFAGLVSVVVTVIASAGPIGDVARVLGLVVIVGAIGGLAMAGRSFGRAAWTLDDLVDAAQRVEAGDYAARVRVPGRGPRPLRELVQGFNQMAERLGTNEAQRRTLLADVSHELRTPLTVVQGNIEAILDGVHPADEAHLAAILEETQVLSRLVDDLRTVTLSDAGSLALHREPTDLSILATDAVGSFASAAAAAGVDLAIEVGDDVPLLDVDPVRIREVLVNLVANALRHTPAGGSVAVDARLERRQDGTEGLVVVVRDTGTGIDPALLPHVFDRFAKAADSRGSGLGLAIARGLVEAHGGTVSVDSRAGAGATFRVTLPLGGTGADGAEPSG